MQNLPIISTKYLKDNPSEILEQVTISKQSFIVSKFGRKKALINLIDDKTATNKKKKAIDFLTHPAPGMWKDRKDMRDPT